MSIYGFLIGLAFVIAFEFFSKKNKIIPKKKENIFFFSLFLISIIGARIYSVISNWSYYSQNIVEIINLKAGGLGIFGGLIFGTVYIYVFSRINKISFIKTTDLLVPFVALGQSIGRWGNYFNTEVFGTPTYLPYGQLIPTNLRPQPYLHYTYFHPVWLYESILNLILFIILFKSSKNQTAIYLVGYGLIRFFLEFLRWDTLVVNNFKIGQILCLSFVFIGISLLHKK